MNTMLGNQNNSLRNQILNFANSIKGSGKTPQQMLNDAISSGKYTQSQIDNAKKLAEQYINLIK